LSALEDENRPLQQRFEAKLLAAVRRLLHMDVAVINALLNFATEKIHDGGGVT
jgi:hypothetical protein